MAAKVMATRQTVEGIVLNILQSVLPETSDCRVAVRLSAISESEIDSLQWVTVILKIEEKFKIEFDDSVLTAGDRRLQTIVQYLVSNGAR